MFLVFLILVPSGTSQTSTLVQYLNQHLPYLCCVPAKENWKYRDENRGDPCYCQHEADSSFCHSQWVVKRLNDRCIPVGVKKCLLISYLDGHDTCHYGCLSTMFNGYVNGISSEKQ